MGENIYYCDIRPLSGQSLLYQIEWSLTSKLSIDQLLRISEFVEYTTPTSFRNITALREQNLLDINVTKIGYTVSKMLHIIKDSSIKFANKTLLKRGT